MNIKLLITGCIIIGCITTGYYLFAVPEAPQKNNPYLEEVQIRDFTIEVRTVGTLEAQNAHMIASQIKGSDAKIIFLAENGASVKEGEVLVKFDPKPFEDQIEELANRTESLKAAVQAAEQLLEWEKNEAEQRIITAEYQSKVAELDLRRLVEGEGPLKLAEYKDEFDKVTLELKHYEAYESDLRKLEQEGISTAIELARIREDVAQIKEKLQSAKRKLESYKDYVLPVMHESARAKVKSSELKIEQIKQASVHKIANAAASLEQMRAKLKGAQVSLRKAEDELDKTIIRAPFDGLIVHYETYRDGKMRLPREGDTTLFNQPILYFPDISTLTVKSSIREVDLHKIKLSQEATVHIDAYPSDTFEGELLFIGALAKKDDGTGFGNKYFQVVFSLDNPDERLRPGMSARVVIHVDQLKQVVSVPVQSIFSDIGGSFCYLYNGVMYEKRYLTTGRQNDDFVEIINGLEVGERVSQIQPDKLL